MHREPIPIPIAIPNRTPFVPSRLPQVGTTIFSVMSALALERGAVNLGQGFPDFDCDPALLDAVNDAMRAGLNQYPEVRGQVYFVRRPLKSRWADALVTRRFQRAGFGVLPKRGGLDAILEVLEAGHTVVFPFDQHAGGRDAIKVDFFGHPAGTLRSLAVLALSTGATVLPAASWREADGGHVLRFEPPLPLLDDEDTNEAIRLNTRAYNRALETLVLRHPEQWFWVHRRWKP